MKTILVAVYAIAALFALLCGMFYPVALRWALLEAGACLYYCGLSLVVAVRPMADAGRISAWSWHGLSVLFTTGLLLAYVLRQEAGWFLAAAALAGFGAIATLIFALVLKPIVVEQSMVQAK